MKFKRFIIPLTAIIIVGLAIAIFMLQNKNGCGTRENRELRLREISNLGEVTTIDQEVTIDGSIISGYTAKNNRHGLAVFVPTGNGKYEFQTNVNRQNDELLFMTTAINQTLYNVFWANKGNLEYAQITYTIDGVTGETIKLNVQNNQFVFTVAPSNGFSVEYHFVDANGTRYQ